MSVTDQQLLERLRVLLGESDLQTTTEKMLRKKLEEEFKLDLTEKKPLIRQEIERYLAEQGGDESEEDEEDDESDEGRARPARGSGLGCILSEPLQKFLGEKSLPRTQVVKRIWDYIKANNLQDPKDKRKIVLDDKLRTLFTSPLNMFSMNTQLSKHCKTNDAHDDSDRPAKRAAAPKAAKASEPKAKKAKAAADADEEGDGDGGGEASGGAKKRGNNAFTQQLRASPELAEWTGKETISRPELTAFFWSYVKEHKLQDPSNKQFIVCDAMLKKLTGEERISGFGYLKHMSKHLLKD